MNINHINPTQGGEREEHHKRNSTVCTQPLPTTRLSDGQVAGAGGQTHLRNVAHIAASQLQDHGYTVIKAVTRSWPCDLIAFNHHHMLLIATRRHTKQQTAKQILQIYQDLISDMQDTPAPPYAEKQIWVYQNGYGFSVYKLFQNGIMRKQGLP